MVRNRRGAHDTAVLCVYRGGEPPGGAAIPVVVRRRGPDLRRIGVWAARALGPGRPIAIPLSVSRCLPRPSVISYFPSNFHIWVTRIRRPLFCGVNRFSHKCKNYRASAHYTEKALGLPSKRSLFTSDLKCCGAVRSHCAGAHACAPARGPPSSRKEAASPFCRSRPPG